MDGYVKNVSPGWAHAFKRAVRPGAEIPLDELYEQYGKKYDLKVGEEFVDWLKTVKLKDSSRWKVIDELTPDTDISEVFSEKKPTTNNSRFVLPKHMSVEDVVELTVRPAREALPNISDIKLLKYALQEAKPRAGKESLCRMLTKRIAELETITRV